MRKAIVLVAVLVALIPAVAGAQNDLVLAPDRATVVQAQLQQIEGNKAAFVENLLWAWAPYVNAAEYDLWSEIGPIAMKAPAWQLYAASLVGDFKTMVKVLSGSESAGKYVTTLAAPEPKTIVDPEAVAADLGSTTDSLVYVPIAPCRVVDTRGAGARTGVIAAGTSRLFDLEAEAFTVGQGVSGTPCTGLPSYSYYAWAVNVTAVGYSGNGWLTIWPAGGTEPTASVINYGSAPYAIANAMNLTGCYGCADDIRVKASSAATHVIIDVVGYYRDAVATPSAATRVAGTPGTLVAGSAGFFHGGACPTGTLLIGGELDHGATDVAIGEFRQDGTNNWFTFWMINNETYSTTVTAYSRCLDTPVQYF